MAIAHGKAPETGSSDLLFALGQGLTAEAPDNAASDTAPGLALLHAIGRIEDGRTGNYAAVSDGLALLMRHGLDETARRAALEIAIQADSS